MFYVKNQQLFVPTRAEAILSVLAYKISILRQKLVIICATPAGANLGVLACKISVLRQNLVIIVPLVRDQI